MEKFQDCYPDGFLISIIREPVGWYASVKKKGGNKNKQRTYLEGVATMTVLSMLTKHT